MRLNRTLGNLTTLAAGALLSACAVDAPTATENEALCSSEAAVSDSAFVDPATPALCPKKQTLIAELREDKAVLVPIRVLSNADVKYCFRDDDNEPHQASLVQDEAIVAKWEADSPCVTLALEPGVYQLRVDHAARPSGSSEADATPDIVHTQWFAADPSGGTDTLWLSVNACPGCNLDGKDWPLLYRDQDGKEHRGYAGNYAGASFKGSRCVARNGFCELGARGVSQNFSGARFDTTRLETPSAKIGQAQVTSDRTEHFLGSSFEGLQVEGDLALVHVTGASFVGAKLTTLSVPKQAGANRLSANFASVALASPGSISGAELDVATLDDLQKLGINVAGNTVRVKGANDFENKSGLDGIKNGYVFPFKGTALDLAGYSFVNAHLANFDFPCSAGSNFRGSDWSNAVITDTSLVGCDLREATLAQVQWDRVDATRANLSGMSVVFKDSTIEFESARLLGTSFQGSTFRSLGLSFADATGANFANIEVADVSAQNANLTRAKFAGAKMVRANFESATLDFANFQKAALDGASFESCKAEGTVFFGAKLTNCSFARATVSGADLKDVNFGYANFRKATVCGGSLTGSNLDAADLEGALIPAETNVFEGIGRAARCEAVIGRDRASTSLTTRCPNGSLGSCTSEAQWTPTGTRPLCCDPLIDANCAPRKRSGETCTQPCACSSLVCGSDNLCQ
jgi:uncharacterized protein YjbI with pentapeptide repeats